MSDALIEDWLCDTGVLVLARGDDGTFAVAGRTPEFFVDMARAEGLAVELAARDPRTWSPFLENFLVDAEAFWRRGECGRVLSGPWCETTRAGRDWELEAAAVTISHARQVLVIQHVALEYAERVAVLQKARSAGLAFDRLQREVQDKEVLLHCVVHDLKTPLASIYGNLSLLKSGKLAPERALQLMQLSLAEAKRQESMIRQLLQVFEAELRALASFDTLPGLAPDLRQCVRVAARAMQSGYERRGVALQVARGFELDERFDVHGRADRLERVVINLLDNALRHSRPGSEVELALVESPTHARVEVRDRGSGVDPSVAPALFQRFVKSARSGGAAGLGLYYCRLTIERWGGRIGFAPRDGGGTCFWFELPRALSPGA